MTIKTMTSRNGPPANPFSSGSTFEIGGDDTTSFQPVDVGLVGTGPMEPANNVYTEPPPVAGQQHDSPKTFLQKIQYLFSTERLKTSFDVDTDDVKERIVGSLKYANKPDYFREQVLGQEGKRPDFYGPIWISMTLAFLLSVSSLELVNFSISIPTLNGSFCCLTHHSSKRSLLGNSEHL